MVVWILSTTNIFEEGILETQPFRPFLNINIYLYKQNYCNILLKAPSMVCMETFNHIFVREHGINSIKLYTCTSVRNPDLPDTAMYRSLYNLYLNKKAGRQSIIRILCLYNIVCLKCLLSGFK